MRRSFVSAVEMSSRTYTPVGHSAQRMHSVYLPPFCISSFDPLAASRRWRTRMLDHSYSSRALGLVYE